MDRFFALMQSFVYAVSEGVFDKHVYPRCHLDQARLRARGEIPCYYPAVSLQFQRPKAITILVIVISTGAQRAQRRNLTRDSFDPETIRSLHSADAPVEMTHRGIPSDKRSVSLA